MESSVHRSTLFWKWHNSGKVSTLKKDKYKSVFEFIYLKYKELFLNVKNLKKVAIEYLQKKLTFKNKELKYNNLKCKLF